MVNENESIYQNRPRFENSGLPIFLSFFNGNYQASDEYHKVINPFTGEPVAGVVYATQKEIECAARSAVEAGKLWATTPVHQRASILERAAMALQESRTEAARTISEETGKALRQALVEVDRAVLTLKTSALEVNRLGGEILVPDALPGGEGLLAYWVRRPIGVVAAITPFNAPLNLACHKIGPALAIGNSVIWKTPPQAPGVGPFLIDAFQKAGLPTGVLAVLHGAADVGEALIRHPTVQAISFTGSISVGRLIQAKAGLKPLLLELGGVAINVIHHDADIQRAAGACVSGAFKNSGQSCNSVQRVMIHEAVWDKTIEQLIELTERQVVGDPLDPRTDIGPVVSEDAARRIEGWLKDAVAHGAQLLTGGKRTGAVITPTIVAGVPPDSPLACEEVFGPVFTVEMYKQLEDVYHIAEALPFGLTHAIFTKSLSIAVEAARRLPSGTVLVNRSSNARLDHLPFGGIRASGLGGREGPRFAMEALSNMQLVIIDSQ